MRDFPLISMLAVGFTAAWVLGLFTQWLRLSPIVGYLLAGVIIGPYTPGFVGDLELAHQLAEVGVILLMFGVGLHFHLEDLLAVKWVAIPGAIGQSLVATVLGMLVFGWFGLEPRTGAVIGMAMAVASTVVLMRVLMDANTLNTPQGHIAVGWLLVEDVLTVIVLVLIPVLGDGPGHAVQAGFWSSPAAAVTLALLKLAALVLIIAFAGSRVVPWVLVQVARLRSQELFTLTVMVFSIAIAAGSFMLFGASMALGAFLAGMVVAQSPVSHQAAADALPLRDAFAVLFFVSVGMLFDPTFLLHEPLMMLAATGIILIGKPLAALVIVAALGYSSRTALTVALGLAQIGEFSFILSDMAREHGLMPEEGHNLLVGGAILSITLNPLLFRSLGNIEAWLARHPRLWKLLNYRAERRMLLANAACTVQITDHQQQGRRLAIVIGYGPVGRSVDKMLREANLETVIVDMNMDTVAELRRLGRTAIFGDASRGGILDQAGAEHASHLVLTLPQSDNRAAIVSLARSRNASLKIFVRARYLREQSELDQVGASATIIEEAEAAVALARLVLVDAGAGRDLIKNAVRDIRTRLILDNVSSLRTVPVRNIMVPWTRVRKLADDMSLDDVRRQVGDTHYSRWPVSDSQSGQPIGYLLAKDLIGHASTGGRHWSTLVRPLGFVHSGDDVESALHYFQREAATMCVVRDGESPAGIVTIEDILEQVVGRMEDEYPRHAKVALGDVLHLDDAPLNLVGKSPEQVIVELTAAIPRHRLPRGVNVADHAIAREREMSTNLGGGVAVPHALCPNLASSIVLFGRSTEGVVFGPRTEERVHLIFLLISPAEHPELQLHLLSQIATIAADAEKRTGLRQARSVADVEQILKE